MWFARYIQAGAVASTKSAQRVEAGALAIIIDRARAQVERELKLIALFRIP